MFYSLTGGCWQNAKGRLKAMVKWLRSGPARFRDTTERLVCAIPTIERPIEERASISVA